MAQENSSTVLKWYQSLRPRTLDLVGDYAGQELFLVEGDALLLKCFSDKRIDFGGKGIFAHYCLMISLKSSCRLTDLYHRWLPTSSRRLCR